MWDLWWKRWHRDKFYCSFPQSQSFCQCSVSLCHQCRIFVAVDRIVTQHALDDPVCVFPCRDVNCWDYVVVLVVLMTWCLLMTVWITSMRQVQTHRIWRLVKPTYSKETRCIKWQHLLPGSSIWRVSQCIRTSSHPVLGPSQDQSCLFQAAQLQILRSEWSIAVLYLDVSIHYTYSVKSFILLILQQ